MIEVGAVVRSIDSRVPMTVTGIDGSWALCCWSRDGDVAESNFHVTTLLPVKNPDDYWKIFSQ